MSASKLNGHIVSSFVLLVNICIALYEPHFNQLFGQVTVCLLPVEHVAVDLHSVVKFVSCLPSVESFHLVRRGGKCVMAAVYCRSAGRSVGRSDLGCAIALDFYLRSAADDASNLERRGTVADFNVS